MSTMRERLRASGPVDLSAIDPRSTPGFQGDKAAGVSATAELGARLADLQERLFANGRAGDRRRVLLVLQAMDSGGKDGAVKHVLGHVNPAGVQAASFGPPTQEERRHHYLWRAERELPDPGFLGVFNRSHYEDVLVVRVHDLVPQEVWNERYDEINAWEAEQVADGLVLVKVMLHLSKDEQRERLLARLDDPTKLWKANPGDVAERGHWDDYQAAYEAALTRCSPNAAPWYVIPADRKWYRNWALASLLVEVLEGLEQDWPVPADLDVEAMRAALRQE